MLVSREKTCPASGDGAEAASGAFKATGMRRQCAKLAGEARKFLSPKHLTLLA
jgi:hypothetical protein